MTASTKQKACQAARRKLGDIEREIQEAAAAIVAARAGGAKTGSLTTRLKRLARSAEKARKELSKAKAAALGLARPSAARERNAPSGPARRTASTKARRAAAPGDGFSGLDARMPLLLLPLRLETKYDGAKLLVRVYPDDVHADGHEPALTDRERRWRAAYLQAISEGRDRAGFLAAWTALARRAGAERALWLATATDAEVQDSRPSAWSRPALARLMPDRFVAFAWTDLAQPPIRADAALPVAEPLAIGPDPAADALTEQAPLGAGAAWLHDPDAARAAGMILEIPLPDANATVVRLIVTGARGTVDAASQAEELAALLNAHRCSTGLDVIAAGTPTNALPDAPLPYRLRPDTADLYEQEMAYVVRDGEALRRQPHFRSGSPPGPFLDDPATASLSMAKALGIDPMVLGFAAGSGDTSLGPVGERGILTMLDIVFRPASEGRLLPGVDAAAVDVAFDYFRDWLSGSGPMASLRLGRQPYGILPVHLPDRARLPPQDAKLLGVLDALREIVFEPATAKVPRIGLASSVEPNPGTVIMDMLRSDAVTRQLRVRPIASAGLVGDIIGNLPQALRDPMEAASRTASDLLRRLGHPSPGTISMAREALFPDGGIVTRPLVAPAEIGPEARRELPSNYLRDLVAFRIPQLVDMGPGPLGVLFDLARLALLQAADRAARAWLVEAGANPAVFNDPGHPLGTPLGRLFSPAPDDPARLTWEGISDPGTPFQDFLDVRVLLRGLAGVRPETLEILLASDLLLLSSRLDAWYTGFASRQLKTIREASPGNETPLGYVRGIGVGAFGWLETIRRARPVRSKGYVHAPSADHAATAAVLMSADVAHQAVAHGSAFAVDLASRRLRTARELLDGIRAAQPLGALLGYRLERSLQDAGGTAPSLVLKLRDIAPLVPDRREPLGAPAETVAADNAVDGLLLLRRAGYDGKSAAPDVANLALGLEAMDEAERETLRKALQKALDAAAAAVDAIADLENAESVHGLVTATKGRAGATAAAVSGSPVPPPAEFEVARTPQRGVPVVHRSLLLFDTAATRSQDWDETPRAAAEPLVDVWASHILPTPAAIRLPFSFGESPSVSATLAELLETARGGGRSDLALGAIDFLLSSDASLPIGGPWIASRMGAMAELMRPVGNTGALQLIPDRPANWPGSDWTLEEAAELARAMRGAVVGSRTLDPRDLMRPGGERTAELGQAEIDALDRRISTIRDVATATRAALDAADEDGIRTRALREAELLGVAAAPEGAPLAQRIEAALADLDRRLAAAADPGLIDGVSRLRALLGERFPVVQRLSLVGSTLKGSFAADIGATEAEARTFVSRVAAVRPAVARVAALDDLAEAVSAAGGDARSRLSILVGQQPVTSGGRWVALPPGPGQAIASGRVSLLALRPGGAAAIGSDKTVAGLMIDEWTEIIPAADAETSVCFHFEAPASAAPNAWLLLVPDDSAPAWTADRVLDHVVEAMDLARLRAVDPDLLSAAVQLLPVLLSCNSGFGWSVTREMMRNPP